MPTGIISSQIITPLLQNKTLFFSQKFKKYTILLQSIIVSVCSALLPPTRTILMKNFLQSMILVLALVSNTASCTTVQIFNHTPVKIDASLDIVAYPDPKKTISKNSSICEDVGNFFTRGVKVDLHIGEHIIENVLHEELSQTLGFGNITYHIFMEIKNMGRTNFVDEYEFELVLYLVRNPKMLYSGGIMSISKPIRVHGSYFDNFTPVEFSKNAKAPLQQKTVCRI